MTTQEKRPIAFLIIDTISFLSYYAIVMSFQDSMAPSLGELSFGGASMILIVPFLILARITAYLCYSIFKTVLTGKKEDRFLKDELSRLIKLKSFQNFSNTFLAGFICTMGLLALGISISTMFQLLFLSLFVAFVILDVSGFYYARRGV